MSVFDTFITDLDGTLCNTLPANIEAYALAFKDAGLTFDKSAYKDNFGLRYKEMMETIAPHATSGQLDEVSERKSVHYAQSMHLAEINMPLLDTLKIAKFKGARLGLATTARRINAMTLLDHFSLSQLFDAFVFGEEVTHGKPNPECYNLIMQKLDATPDSCIVFEDSQVGVTAALKAKTNVIKVAM